MATNIGLQDTKTVELAIVVIFIEAIQKAKCKAKKIPLITHNKKSFFSTFFNSPLYLIIMGTIKSITVISILYDDIIKDGEEESLIIIDDKDVKNTPISTKYFARDFIMINLLSLL